MKDLFKKAGLMALATAFAFAVSTTAVQAANTVTTEQEASVLTEGSWETDRTAPSGWSAIADAVTVSIDESVHEPGFYSTEGKKKQLNETISIEANLFLDPEWADMPARAGIWGTSDGAVAEWGIIDYTTASTYVVGQEGPLTKSATFRTWDSRDGTWTAVGTSYELGTTVKLRVELSNDAWHYYINDIFIRSVPLETPDASYIKEIILNQFNFSAVVNTTAEFLPSPYTVAWTGLKTVQAPSFDTIQEAIEGAEAGDIIIVSGNFTEDVTVDKAVTIDATGATLTGSVLITASNVTIEGLTVDGSTGHGINIYKATGVTLTDVTVSDSAKSGITVNGSIVVAHNLTTENNAWGGVNVDLGVGVEGPASLTLTGDASFTETGPAVWKDDNSKAVTIIGMSSDYLMTLYEHTVNEVEVEGTAYYYNVVKTEGELTAALLNDKLTTIKFGADIASESAVMIDREVTIDGNDTTLTLNAPGNGGASTLGLGVNTTATIKDLTITTSAALDDNLVEIVGADTVATFENVTVKESKKAGIIILDGAELVLNGDIELSENAWGGIEIKHTEGTKLSLDGVDTLIYLPKEGTNTPVAWVDLDVSVTAGDFVSDASGKISAPAKVGTQVWWKALPIVTEDQPVLIIDNTNTTPITVIVEEDVDDAVLDLVSIASTNGTTTTVTTPTEITVQSEGLVITIPSGTIISGNSNTWSGEISLPKEEDGDDLDIELGTREELTVGIAISVGSDDTNLTFNHPVKLVLAGQTGKRVGFIQHLGEFSEITNECGNDSGASIVGFGECKYDNGTDMVIWTKHFTTFATYEITTIPRRSSGSKNSRAAVAATAAPVVAATPAATTPALGQVLGAEDFIFTAFMKVGGRGNEVMELQKLLNAQGHGTLTVDGIFGPKTMAAVVKFQTAQTLVADGIVGPMTRAALNK